MIHVPISCEELRHRLPAGTSVRDKTATFEIHAEVHSARDEDRVSARETHNSAELTLGERLARQGLESRDGTMGNAFVNPFDHDAVYD